ncbi:MAG TPA: hypothetical protein VIW80_07765 [Pyrinomonadaceae bacterium]|jgi:hypothetical protein
MAVKKESRRKHNPVKTSSREAATRAAQLAPPEERAGAAKRAKRERGQLSIDTGELKLPEGLRADDDDAAQGSFHLEPVVLFILGAALAFIAFITYLISIEPAK